MEPAKRSKAPKAPKAPKRTVLSAGYEEMINEPIPISGKRKPVDPNINPETGLYYPLPGGAKANTPQARRMRAARARKNKKD